MSQNLCEGEQGRKLETGKRQEGNWKKMGRKLEKDGKVQDGKGIVMLVMSSDERH